MFKPGTSLEAQATGNKLQYFGHHIRSGSLKKELMLVETSANRKGEKLGHGWK